MNTSWRCDGRPMCYIGDYDATVAMGGSCLAVSNIRAAAGADLHHHRTALIKIRE